MIFKKTKQYSQSNMLHMTKVAKKKSNPLAQAHVQQR